MIEVEDLEAPESDAETVVGGGGNPSANPTGVAFGTGSGAGKVDF